MNRISRRTVLGGLIATPFVAAGLGGGLAQEKSTPGGSPAASPDASPSASPMASPMASPAAGGDSIEVIAVDIRFDQETLEIPADTDVTIILTNEGMLQHDLFIEDTEFRTELLDSGQSTELQVNLPAGEYVYYCSVAGHRQAGMEGTLTVA